MEYSPKKMIDKMNENNFGFKKKFGQNFIIDENIINGISILAKWGNLSIAIVKLQTGVPEPVCLSSGSRVSLPIKIALLIISNLAFCEITHTIISRLS